MLDIGFGEDIEYISLIGEKRIVARFAIHVQSSWRIIKKDTIILASYDFYLPKNNFSNEEFNQNSFGNSKFDVKSLELNKRINLNPISVIDISSNVFGDVTIFMEDDCRFEIFVDSSEIEEFWRFYEMDTEKEHFVVLDKD